MAAIPPIDDHYTGKLAPGAAPQRRQVGGATIIKTSVGPMDNNAYLITCGRTGETVLIDAANDAESLINLVEGAAPHLALIVTTHQHGDHWQALADVHARTGAPTAAHPLDAGPLPVQPDRLLKHGDTVRVGDLALDVVHLRGHTPGSVALALTLDEKVHLFSGDSLFPGGVGKTWRPEDFEQLLDDVVERVFDEYRDDTVVYPGHGADTTLGEERPHLGEWRQRGW